MSDLSTFYTNPDVLAAKVVEQVLQHFAEKAARLWTKEECAAYLQCTPVHLDTLIRTRNFPFIDISNPTSKSRDLRFSPEAVKAWEVGQK